MIFSYGNCMEKYLFPCKACSTRDSSRHFGFCLLLDFWQSLTPWSPRLWLRSWSSLAWLCALSTLLSPTLCSVPFFTWSLVSWSSRICAPCRPFTASVTAARLSTYCSWSLTLCSLSAVSATKAYYYFQHNSTLIPKKILIPVCLWDLVLHWQSYLKGNSLNQPKKFFCLGVHFSILYRHYC